MNTDELLQKYKEISLAIAEKLKNDEDVLELFKMRENIIKEIQKLNEDKDNIADKINKLGIMELDKELEQLLKNSMEDVKKELAKVKQSKQAYNKYSGFSSNAAIFSTKR